MTRGSVLDDFGSFSGLKDSISAQSIPAKAIDTTSASPKKKYGDGKTDF